MNDTLRGGPEPGDAGAATRGVWIRGLKMLILGILLGAAQTLLGIAAVLQFGWMLFAGGRNAHLASFGRTLGAWMHEAVLFETGASDLPPFPFAPIR